MKKLILCLLAMIVFASNSLAQSKFITKEVYNEALGKAAKKQDSVPHRVKGEIVFYDSKKAVVEKRISMVEHLSPDTFRSTFTNEKNGTIIKRNEYIKIGNVEYTKTDDEAWKKTELSRDAGKGGGSGFLLGKEIKNQRLEEFLLVPTTIDGKSADIYFHYDVTKSEDSQGLRFIESRNIIGADGLTIKWIYKVSNTVPENVSHISTTTYEYNPSDLKIEAPIK